MASHFRIHPAIGIARVGDSVDSFYLAPEAAGELPIDCDIDGITSLQDNREPTISSFRDESGRIRRQGARFRIYSYHADADITGSEIAIDEPISFVYPKTGQHIEGILRDVEWTSYLANKKAIWYEFQETNGEYGYAPDHPRRNAAVVDPDARQRMIIDPGPRTVNLKNSRAAFSRTERPIAQSFPPPLNPRGIDTLGELLATAQPIVDTQGKAKRCPRLVVLGGHGHAGTMATGPGEPKIQSFANNDGWFDDEADGYVLATLVVDVKRIDGKEPVNTKEGALFRLQLDEPAWVIVGYPRYAPQIVDMITMDETMYDVFVRKFAYDTELYGLPPFDGSQKAPATPDQLEIFRTNGQYNPNYYPRFWRDIWPVLRRPNQYSWVMDFDNFTGGDPHSTSPRGNLDPAILSVSPYEGQNPEERRRNAEARAFVYGVLRQPQQINLYTLPGGTKANPNYRLPGMPLLCGDNPISNTSPSKFLRLTDTTLFLMKQWRDGKFIDEKTEHLPEATRGAELGGRDLDRGVLGNMLGGAFCPGAEATWIMRNPAVYTKPYRIKLSPTMMPGSLSQQEDLRVGLEPGDLTKRNAVPWQADFNECSTQSIDITYEGWNEIYSQSIGAPVQPSKQTIYWWPSHRPMEVTLSTGAQVPWSGTIPSEHTGDLAMVTAWKEMGFVVDFNADTANPQYVLQEGWNSVPPLNKHPKGVDDETKE